MRKKTLRLVNVSVYQSVNLTFKILIQLFKMPIQFS